MPGALPIKSGTESLPRSVDPNRRLLVDHPNRSSNRYQVGEILILMRYLVHHLIFSLDVNFFYDTISMQTDLELDRRCIHLGYIISRIEILGAVQQLFFDVCRGKFS